MTASPAVHPTSDPAPATPAPVVLLMEKIRALAEQRRQHARHREEHTQRQIRFQELHPAFFSALGFEQEAIAHEAEEIEAAEAELRALGVTAYQVDQNPKPAPGIEVKLFDVLAYDEVQALAWGISANNTAVIPASLDKKEFNKIAKTGVLPFVRITQEPRVLIASDLDKALGIAEVTS